MFACSNIFLCIISDHKKADEASKQSQTMVAARHIATSKSEAAVTAALKNVYYAAKQNLPSSVIPSLNSLCIVTTGTSFTI